MRLWYLDEVGQQARNDFYESRYVDPRILSLARFKLRVLWKVPEVIDNVKAFSNLETFRILPWRIGSRTWSRGKLLPKGPKRQHNGGFKISFCIALVLGSKLRFSTFKSHQLALSVTSLIVEGLGALIH